MDHSTYRFLIAGGITGSSPLNFNLNQSPKSAKGSVYIEILPEEDKPENVEVHG